MKDQQNVNQIGYLTVKNTALNGEIVKRKLSQMKMDILQTIKQHADWSITRVAQHCRIGYYTTIQIMKKLEGEGLVTKEENSTTKNNVFRGSPATVYSVC